jgi:hypothetical protein
MNRGARQTFAKQGCFWFQTKVLSSSPTGENMNRFPALLVLALVVQFNPALAANLKLGDYATEGVNGWRSEWPEPEMFYVTLGNAYKYCCMQNGLSYSQCSELGLAEMMKLKTHLPSMEEIAQILVNSGAKYSKIEQPGLRRYEFRNHRNSTDIFYSDFNGFISDYREGGSIIWTSSSYQNTFVNPPEERFLGLSQSHTDWYSYKWAGDASLDKRNSLTVRCVTAD